NTIKVKVTASNSAGSSSATSSATGIIHGTPVNQTTPTISGTPNQGQTLTANKGTWTGALTFSYQWQHRVASGPNAGTCVDISGATGTTYVVDATDVGFTIKLEVTGNNPPDSTTVFSNETAAVQAVPTNTVKPTISGNAFVGQTLTANPGTW